ncbi:MAG TPA: S-methyl-5-thioribose-1-phosphate isomerase [Candidatus Dormibacteraeota bacterium]|nr:S-methyl-5-thioribose-1-phosphate isomerase [Candidatus Dormibacteraeota bacterium]
MRPVSWAGDGVAYVDQRELPARLLERCARTTDEVVEAIAALAVRGAPLIGVFGAYGVALAARRGAAGEPLRAEALRIRAARPTAVNLMWAVDRMLAAAEAGADSAALLAEAEAIHRETRATDERMARFGAELLPEHGVLLTHCNTGPLATGGAGTALGVIIEGHRGGKRLHVYVDETRPLLQGARLTAFELREAGVPATLIVDGAAAATMRAKGVQAVLVGADRIARNGDTANKIGTYGLAVAAAHHGIPFYVVAPRSTFDFSLGGGAEIPIEERGADEVRAFGGRPTAPEGMPAYNPAFDVTPGHLVTAIVTEYGVLRPPYLESIAGLELRPTIGSLMQTGASAPGPFKQRGPHERSGTERVG